MLIIEATVITILGLTHVYGPKAVPSHTEVWSREFNEKLTNCHT